jgi:hypothetical protein
MKLRTNGVILITITLTSIFCGKSDRLSDYEKAAMLKEVQNTLHNYYHDIKESGLTAEFKYLDSSADFFWVPPGYAIPISYDSVVHIIKQHAAKFKRVDNSFDRLKIVILNKELATYSGRIKSSITAIDNTINTLSLVETGVLIKRKNGWKLLSGQSSILSE